MDIEAFRKAGYKAIDQICDYYASLESESLPVVSKVEPGYLVKALPDHAPEIGESIESIVKDFQDLILPGITHWQHPSFFAYFPSIATFESILGDLYSSSVNNPGFNWACSPASTELETIVLDWSAKLLGLDSKFWSTSGKGGGVIQTTASDAALLAAVAARSHFSKKNPAIPIEKLIIYGTTQTHSLGAKAALVLGVQFRAIEVKEEDGFGLRAETLKNALIEDREQGLYPFILMATVGTTSSGAVDYINEIGEVLQEEENKTIWLHVDAAWAGVAFALPEYRSTGRLEDVNRFGWSFCTNFHKWGLTNFDCSAFWVSERTLLTDALDVTPEFLRTKQGDSGAVVDYRNWHLALGRKFRSLKLWFVLRSFGVGGFRAHLQKGVEFAKLFADSIERSEHFRLVVPPTLSLVVFQLVPPQTTITNTQEPTPTITDANSTEETNALNRRFHEHLTNHTDLWLTRTELGGKICLRMSVGGYRTEEKHVLRALEVLEKEAKAFVQ